MNKKKKPAPKMRADKEDEVGKSTEARVASLEANALKAKRRK